ncbi:MAG: protein kinase [Verrucomicrobia bacterium]|nr:protein kinase [Verrucomicrobiota bacterium]
MALQFPCSSCHELFPVALEETGKAKRCPACGAVVALPAHPLSAGYHLGDWMVCGSLGVGRNGSIYQAQNVTTLELAALRVPEDDLIGGPDHVDAFCESMSRLRGLQHPGVTRILFSGSIGDVCFYGMEFCEGGCLPVLLMHGRLAEADAWRILEQLAEGLAYLHRQDVIPADINPSKVVFDRDGNAKWSDFLLARPLRVNNGPPGQPPRLGTPAYVSPEQARGGAIDARSNLYSLGAIAFEMLTGRPPFAKATDAETIAAQLEEPAPDPSALAPVSHWTAVLVQRLLARDPAERFQNADHLVAALRASPPPPAPPRRARVSIVKLATSTPKVAGTPARAAASPKTSPHPTPRPRQSHAPLIVFASLVAAVLLVVGLIGWRISHQQRLQREYDAQVAAEAARARSKSLPPAPKSEPAPPVAAKNPPPPAAPPIRASADGSFVLSAASAILHGKTIRRGNDKNTLGHWSRPDDWVEWKFTVREAGKFAITADLATPNSAKFEIHVAGKKLAAVSPKTGDYNKYQTVTPGTVELAVGNASLSIKPVKQGWNPMNLKTVRLKPSE